MFDQQVKILEGKSTPRRRHRGEQRSPGSRPLSNHVPRECTRPFPNPHSDIVIRKVDPASPNKGENKFRPQRFVCTYTPLNGDKSEGKNRKRTPHRQPKTTVTMKSDSNDIDDK